MELSYFGAVKPEGRHLILFGQHLSISTDQVRTIEYWEKLASLATKMLAQFTREKGLAAITSEMMDAARGHFGL